MVDNFDHIIIVAHKNFVVDLETVITRDNSNNTTPEHSSGGIIQQKHSCSVKFGKSLNPYNEKHTPDFEGNIMDNSRAFFNWFELALLVNTIIFPNIQRPWF